MSVFKDAGHLFRFAGLFVLAFLLFLVIRSYVVPHSFGRYGHYRADALGEIASRPVKMSGHETCETCHSDVADMKKAGKHAHVNCEACHGAIFQRSPNPNPPKLNPYERFVALFIKPIPPDDAILHHADDPTSVKPVLPDTKVLCARCHTASAAKPKGFPQVAIEDHSNGLACDTCHKPHNPGLADDKAGAPTAAGGAK